MDKTELSTLEAAVKMHRRRFEASARGFSHYPSAANFAGHQEAMADLQAACLELVTFKRQAGEAAARSDAWLRATS